MDTKSKLLLGLQLPNKIKKQEINDILYTFNQKLKTNDVGFIQTATLHKKNSNQIEKELLIISIKQYNEAGFDKILKLYPQLKIIKRYLIVDFSSTSILDIENLSFQQFIELLEESEYFSNSTGFMPNCILKAMYQHYFSLSGDIIWFNGKQIHLDIGKYYARQLYCQLFLDCIKTEEGYKIPADAIIYVTEEGLLPQFQNKQIILSVLEEKNGHSFEKVLTNQFKIALN